MIARLAGCVLALASPAIAQEAKILVPAITIYPGDVIADNSLVETTLPYALPAGAALVSRAQIVGKLARRTLLPGKPVPSGAVEEPRLVQNGAQVRLVFEESGLSINAVGQALDPGGHGDTIRVRNNESGLVVPGVVQNDGTVRVGG